MQPVGWRLLSFFHSCPFVLANARRPVFFSDFHICRPDASGRFFCAVSPLLLLYKAVFVTPILLLYGTEPCPPCNDMQRGGCPLYCIGVGSRGPVP